MSLCVIPIGSGDSGVQMDTCQSNQEENAKKHGKAGDIMENTDLEDSTVGWDMDSLLYYDLPTQVKKVSEYMRDSNQMTQTVRQYCEVSVLLQLLPDNAFQETCYTFSSLNKKISKFNIWG